MRMRGLSLIAVSITSLACLAAAGCAATGGAQFAPAAGIAASASSEALPIEPSPVEPTPTADGRSPAPAATRTTPGAPPPGGTVARLCRMGDLRFWLSRSLPAAGPFGSGSVQMTNTAADNCRVSGYLTVRWLDGSGKLMPITVERLPGTMPAYTSLLQPGKSASARLEWRRSRALPSDPEILCPPAPATLEARLSTEDTFARIPWTPAEGLCDAKAGLRPIEKSP